jgi:GTPase SAR1 family protein
MEQVSDKIEQKANSKVEEKAVRPEPIQLKIVFMGGKQVGKTAIL